MSEQLSGPGSRHSVATPVGSPLLHGRVNSIPEVLDRLEAIQNFAEATQALGKHDGVACFNYLYHVITGRVQENVGTGFFQDDEFLTRLDVAFANRYFDALRAHEADPGSAPRSWAALFEHRSEPNVLPMQFAVAGVNAHVNYDLPFALIDACRQLDRPLEHVNHKNDFNQINAIFATEMEDLRMHFESRLGRFIDEYLVPYVDNLLGRWSVKAAREAAWLKAEVLEAARNDPVDTEKHRLLIDKQAGLVGQTLLVELVPVAAVFRLEGSIERLVGLFLAGPLGAASLLRRAIERR